MSDTTEAGQGQQREIHTYILDYDIPDRLGALATTLRASLRRRAVWLSGSVWLVPSHRVPDDIIQRLADNGVRHRLTPAWMDEEAVRRLFVEQTEKQVQAKHTALIKRLGNASDAIQRALDAVGESDDTEKARDKAQKAYRNRVRRILSDARTALKEAIDAAEVFDATMEIQDVVEALRKAIDAEKKAIDAALAAVTA